MIGRREDYAHLPIYFDNDLWALETNEATEGAKDWLPRFAAAGTLDMEQFSFRDVQAWPGRHVADKVNFTLALFACGQNRGQSSQW